MNSDNPSLQKPSCIHIMRTPNETRHMHIDWLQINPLYCSVGLHPNGAHLQFNRKSHSHPASWRRSHRITQTNTAPPTRTRNHAGTFWHCRSHSNQQQTNSAHSLENTAPGTRYMLHAKPFHNAALRGSRHRQPRCTDLVAVSFVEASSIAIAHRLQHNIY